MTNQFGSGPELKENEKDGLINTKLLAPALHTPMHFKVCAVSKMENPETI